MKNQSTTPKTPDFRSYESSYTSWKLLEKYHSELDHRDHGPRPATFGVSEIEAKFIRARVDRELARKA